MNRTDPIAELTATATAHAAALNGVVRAANDAARKIEDAALAADAALDAYAAAVEAGLNLIRSKATQVLARINDHTGIVAAAVRGNDATVMTLPVPPLVRTSPQPIESIDEPLDECDTESAHYWHLDDEVELVAPADMMNPDIIENGKTTEFSPDASRGIAEAFAEMNNDEQSSSTFTPDEVAVEVGSHETKATTTQTPPPPMTPSANGKHTARKTKRRSS